MITTDSVLDDIRAHGAEAYPEEGCGFLLGTVTAEGRNHVTRVRRVPNRQSVGRTHRYQLTAEDYRAADSAAQDRGLNVVGVYHSHPDHPARPSETDLAEATFPGFTYVIVAVDQGTPVETTAWTLAPDRSRFTQEDIMAQSEPTV